MRIQDLKQKDVINTCTCKVLGSPVDVIFDCKNGCLTAIVVPGPAKLCNLLGRDGEYVIPWTDVCQIGEDIILVEIDDEKCYHKL